MITIILSIFASLFVCTLFASQIRRIGFPLNEGKSRLGAIDGLRGYLALMVMAHHFIIWSGIVVDHQPWQPPQVNFFNQLGGTSVAIFFMITGLLFYPRIIGGLTSNNWIKIYSSRIFRINPLLLCLTLAITVLILARGDGSLQDFELVPYLKWVSGLGYPPLLGFEQTGDMNARVLWSLLYEWIFYIAIMPVMAATFQLSRRLLSPGILMGLLCIIAFLAQFFVSLPLGLERYLPFFAIGMLTYHLLQVQWLSAALSHKLFTPFALAALATAMILFHEPFGVPAILIAVFFVAVASGNTLYGLLETDGALVLGEASYSIYLLHGLVLNIAFVDFAGVISRLPQGAFPVLLIPLSVIVAATCAATFLLIERPFIKLGKYLIRNRRSPASQVATPRTI